jgi:hypothetical protein
MAKKSVKKSEKTEKIESSDVGFSIPMAGDREAPVRRRSAIIDRYRSKMKPMTPAVKADSRPIIDIDDETKEKFVTFAATKELFDIFEETKKEQTSELYAAIFEKYKDALWNSKTQPKNPAIKVNKPDGSLEAEGQFIVQVGSKVKINMPPVDDDELPESALIASLVNLGVNESNAIRLVENEVSFVPQWSLNLTEMLDGVIVDGRLQPASDDEVRTSELLFQVIKGHDEDGNDLNAKSRLEMLKKIPENGWDLIRQNVENHTKFFPQLVAGADFLDRVCGYAESREELDLILTVFCPVHFCQRVKFACSDSPDVKTARLVAEATSEITKSENNEEIERAYRERSK